MAEADNIQIVAQRTINTDVATIGDLINMSEYLIYNVDYCWSGLLFRESVREKISAARNELDFDAMRNEVFEDENQLSEVGLVGAQLDLKLSGLSEELVSFVETPSIQKLLSIFDWLISIFGSLANSSKKIEQLKEFIETLKNLIDAE